MVFHNLVKGKLVKRYKRFLADVELEDGNIVVAHCTNSGSMISCLEEGASVCLSKNSNPNRKTKYTWEMIFINNHWVGVNTLNPNTLVSEAIKKNKIKAFSAYGKVQREVIFGESRIDILASNDSEKCFIEVKNVTMKVGEYAKFPDAKTIRGKKHLETLIQIKNVGNRAAMVYVVQRKDVKYFSPCWEIDPDYSAKLMEAALFGVELYAIKAHVTPQAIELTEELPINLNK